MEASSTTPLNWSVRGTHTLYTKGNFRCTTSIPPPWKDIPLESANNASRTANGWVFDTQRDGPSGVAFKPDVPATKLYCMVFDAPGGGSGDDHNSVSAVSKS